MPYELRYEGDFEVLENLFRKKYLLERGDISHQYIRTAALACPGVMRGVYAGGGGIALDRFRLTDVLDDGFGISTGGPAVGFFLAGQVQKHIDLYWNEAASERFIHFPRFWQGSRPVADTDYICGVFRDKMDQEAIRRSRTRFFVGATCVNTGGGHFIDAKATKPDIVEAIHASLALPKLCGRVVTINGIDYVDGSGAMSFPVQKIVETFDPTDLLIFANCPSEDKGSAAGNLFSAAMLAGFPLPLQKAFARRHKDFAEGVQYARNARVQKLCRIGIVWTDDAVGRFERDQGKLQAAALRAQKHMEDLLYDARAKFEASLQSSSVAAE